MSMSNFHFLLACANHAPTSVIEPSVQVDFECRTVCRQTSDSWTCPTVVLDSRWRHFILAAGPQRSVNLF